MYIFGTHTHILKAHLKLYLILVNLKYILNFSNFELNFISQQYYQTLDLSYKLYKLHWFKSMHINSITIWIYEL